MAPKQPTLTSGLTVNSPGVKFTPTSQMGLLGSLLEKIGVKPLGQQLAEEQQQKERALLSKDLDTQKGTTQLSQLGLGPVSFSDDVQNFIKQDAINKQRIAQKEKELSGNLSDVEGSSVVQSQQLGDKFAGIDQSPTGIGSDVKEKEDDTFEIGEASDADIDYTDVGEPGSLDDETKEKSEQEQLFANVMDD